MGHAPKSYPDMLQTVMVADNYCSLIHTYCVPGTPKGFTSAALQVFDPETPYTFLKIIQSPRVVMLVMTIDVYQVLKLKRF